MANLYSQLQAQLRSTPPPLSPSPIGNFPDIANYLASSGSASWYGNVPEALGREASINMDIQRKNAEAARQNRILALKQQKETLEKEMQAKGLGDYQRKPKKVGYDFFDPQGRPITAYEFARAKGVGLRDVLQESNNVQDKQIVEEYEGLDDFTSLVSIPEKERTSEENTALEDYYKINPELRNMPPQEVLNKFMNQYSHVFRLSY